MKIVIIGKGKVGEATGQTFNVPVDYHDPYKGHVINDFAPYDLAIVCVDTLRAGPDDHKDLTSVVSNLIDNKFKGIVAIRCTINPNYIMGLADTSLRIVMFPEFMRQTDDLKLDNPWVVVLGGLLADTVKLMDILVQTGYCKDRSKYLLMSWEEAAIVKLGQNSGLATKVIFYNMINELCEKYNANYDLVRRGIGADERVGIQYSVVPSPDDGLKGFKGHCLPKDLECMASVETHGFFRNLLDINKKLGRE
jgi:UDP-glucose 6-dehydrogenase